MFTGDDDDDDDVVVAVDVIVFVVVIAIIIIIIIVCVVVIIGDTIIAITFIISQEYGFPIASLPDIHSLVSHHQSNIPWEY